jgi:hypothetical protein
MSDLPRRHIEPLEPPPDSFDRVLGAARRRRRNRGLIAASSTMVVASIAAASFALAASVGSTAPARIPPAGVGPHRNWTPEPVPQPSPSPSGKPQHHAGAVKTGPGRQTISWLRGRAVDSSGKGIAGLYVLPGIRGLRSFSTDGRAPARTDARGYYRIACPGAPVLLATWRVNYPYAGRTAGGTWGATFVGSKNGAPVVPRCDAPSYRSVLSPGATVTGQVNDTGSCVPGDEYHVWLWLGGNHGITVRLLGLHSGETFTFSGLPAGTHTLGLRGQTKSVQVAAGATVTANVDFACDKSTATPDVTSTTASPAATSEPPTGGFT